ncbi:MAG TPA: PAS domain S-box protein [Planctomycetota bacterium]|nr:PAS domain S-box protein [Planctomycetota bacterium]
MSPPVMEPITEALHLRRLIEQQPACLLRAGVDGLLLAVNEAALRLLGGEHLTQVLGTNLSKLIVPRQHEEWREFAARVRDGASASIECDLSDLSGTRRTILLQGVPLLDHADGVPSMILTARDISVPLRLEAALREREITRELDDLHKQLQQGISEPPQDETVSGDHQINDSESIQAAMLVKEQEAQQLLDSVRAELEQARAEQQRLTTLLSDREIGHERMVAAHAAERTQVQQTLADEHQLALLLKEREGRQLLESVRGDLAQARAEQQRLTALHEDSELLHQRAVAAHAAAEALHAASVAQLQRTLEEEHQAALLRTAREAKDLLDAGRTELEQARAEQQRLAALLDARTLDHQRAVAAHEAERARLQQTLAEEHQLALLLKERDGQQLLDNVRTELERAVADRQHFAETLDQRDVVIADHEAKRTEAARALADAVAQSTAIEKVLADQGVALRAMDENARNLERLAATGRVALEVGRELQTIIEAVDARTQHLLGESALDADNRHVFEALRVDAIDAASLARQILQAEAGTTMTIESNDDGGKL